MENGAEQKMLDCLFYLLILVILAATFVNGATDAPVLLGGSILSGALSARGAAAVSALGNLAGLLLSLTFFPSVAATVTTLARFGEDRRVGLCTILAVLGSALAWAVAAWRLGIPTSESHALLAGLMGASVALGEGANVLGGAFEVLLGLVLSLGGGYLFCRILLSAFRSASRRVLCPQGDRPYRRAAILLAAATSFLHGAQDGQKFTGVLLLALSFGGIEAGRSAWVLSALVLAAGSACIRGRILDRLEEGRALSVRGALASELSAALCLALCTALGLPVSTTHTKTAALTAAKKDGDALSLSLILAWLLTFPVCFFLSLLATRLFLLF